MTPGTVARTNPVCRKFNPALRTKRRLFVSDAFKREEPGIWLLILEMLVSHEERATWRWDLLNDRASWARARVAAERGRRAAEVLALVSTGESAEGLPHVFSADGFMKFILKEDDARLTLGLGSL